MVDAIRDMVWRLLPLAVAFGIGRLIGWWLGGAM